MGKQAKVESQRCSLSLCSVVSLIMVKRLSLYAKTRITRLHSSGASQKTILDDLRKDGIIVTRRTVRLFLKKYEQTGSFADRPRSGRPCKFPEGLNKLVSDLYENDDELSAHDVSVILHEIFKISVSAAHIRRIRRKVGLAGLHIVRLFEKKTGSIASTSVLRRSDGGIHLTTSFSQMKVQ